MRTVPPAVAGGCVRVQSQCCIQTHPLPQVVLTSSKLDQCRLRQSWLLDSQGDLAEMMFGE